MKRPNLSVNTDALSAALRASRGSPVALNVRRHIEKGTKAKEPYR